MQNIMLSNLLFCFCALGCIIACVKQLPVGNWQGGDKALVTYFSICPSTHPSIIPGLHWLFPLCCTIQHCYCDKIIFTQPRGKLMYIGNNPVFPSWSSLSSQVHLAGCPWLYGTSKCPWWPPERPKYLFTTLPSGRLEKQRTEREILTVVLISKGASV